MGSIRPGLLLAFVLAVAAYLPMGARYAARGEGNSDEGFYAYASYAVMHGQVPYRDFGYNQEPLLPYLQGPAFAVVGYGVRQERWLNVALGSVAVGLAVLLWADAGLPLQWGLLLAFSWSLAGVLVYFETIGKTYASASVLLVAAAFLVPPGRGGPVLRWCGLSVLCVLAVGCRLTAGPSAAVLGIGYAIIHRGKVPGVLLVGVPVLATLVLITPFYALDPANAFFWTWVSHRGAGGVRRMGTLIDAATLAPVPALLGIAALVALGWLIPARRRPPAAPFPWAGACILASGLVGWAVPPFMSGVYAEYGIPGVPLVITGSGLILAAVLARPWFQPFRQPVYGAAGLLVAAFLWIQPGPILPGYLDAIDQAAAVAASLTQKTDCILTSMPEIALVAGRRVYPRLECGKFGVTGEMPPNLAAARHILTFAELCDILDATRVPVVVLFAQNDRVNFGWSLPTMRPIPDVWFSRLQGIIATRYDKAYSNAYFIVLKSRQRRGEIR